MTGRVVQIEKEYIVYKFWGNDRLGNPDTDKFFQEHKVKMVPMILVFDKGKVVKRFEGIVDMSIVTKGVKTKNDQKDLWPFIK